MLTRATVAKCAHIDVILEEQSSQVQDNICNEEKLSQKAKAMDGRISRSTSNLPFQPRKPEAPRNDIPQAVTVTFNSVCNVPIVPEDKRASKSYSRQDIWRSNQTMLCDILWMRREITSAPVESISHDRLYDWVGLERFISQACRNHIIYPIEYPG